MVRLSLYSSPVDLPVSIRSDPAPCLPLEVGKLALAAVVPQVQEGIENPFSFPQLKRSPSGSRYFPHSTLRVHPGAPQVWARGTRLGFSRLRCFNTTLFLNCSPHWTFPKRVVATASKATYRWPGCLLFLGFLPLLALAFMLSLTLDSIHLAGPRSLRLSLNRVGIPFLFSLLSTL